MTQSWTFSSFKTVKQYLDSCSQYHSIQPLLVRSTRFVRHFPLTHYVKTVNSTPPNLTENLRVFLAGLNDTNCMFRYRNNLTFLIKPSSSEKPWKTQGTWVLCTAVYDQTPMKSNWLRQPIISFDFNYSCEAIWMNFKFRFKQSVDNNH